MHPGQANMSNSQILGLRSSPFNDIALATTRIRDSIDRDMSIIFIPVFITLTLVIVEDITNWRPHIVASLAQ